MPARIWSSEWFSSITTRILVGKGVEPELEVDRCGTVGALEVGAPEVGVAVAAGWLRAVPQPARTTATARLSPTRAGLRT
jgi:hypothetical protein